jgi:hypothetical protein
MPAFDQRQVQRARFAVETSFGTDLTTDVATNFFDMRHEPLVISRDTMMTADTTVVQRNYQRRNYVRGPDHGGAALTSFWCGTDEALDASTSPTKTAQSKMLEALLGGYEADQGSLVASGGATTGCVVTAAQGTRFTEGTIVGVVVSGVTYPVLLTSVSTDTLVWWPALPGVPDVGAAVYGSQSNYLTDTPAKWIQVLSEAAKDRNNIWLGVGGQGDFSLDITRGQLAKWSSTIKFARWLHDDEITTPQGGGAIAAATYDGTGPIYANEGGCHFSATSVSTRTLVRVQSLTLSFGVEWFEVGLHSGTEGLGQWERNTRGEITAEMLILPPSNYEAYHDLWSAETDVGFLYWLGSAGGSGRALAVPTCQIMKPPEPAEVYGMEGLKLSLLVKENSKCSALTNEIQRTPFVLASY